MPGMDGTGPLGNGPATGLGRGLCAVNNGRLAAASEQNANVFAGFNGRGMGRGMGRGRLRGRFCRAAYINNIAAKQSAPTEPSPQDENSEPSSK